MTFWKSGELRPLCVFDGQRMPYQEKITATMAWSDMPTCKEQGLATEYLMLRGIFMPAGVPKDAVEYYVGVFSKMRDTQEWRDFMAQGAFNTTVLSGEVYRDWVAKAETTHKELMTKAGFLAERSSGMAESEEQQQAPGVSGPRASRSASRSSSSRSPRW